MNASISVDEYFSRRFVEDEYECVHLTRDVWLDLTGENLEVRLKALRERSSERRIHVSDVKGFVKLSSPEDPCIVLMRRPKTHPHMGVYLRGRVLHLTDRGVYFCRPEVVRLVYPEMDFYR